MSPLVLAVLSLVALNVLLILLRAWKGREPRRVRPVDKRELIEIHDDWSWPR